MIVVDTSVAFKWFDESEDNFNEAISILDKHVLQENKIIVPDLFFYELTNAWSTKTSFEIETIKTHLKLLNSYSLEIVNFNFELLEKAARFAKKYQVTLYDGIYAVLAVENKCELVTADIKFADQVKLKYVKRLDKYS